jgi:hypothetical protein
MEGKNKFKMNYKTNCMNSRLEQIGEFGLQQEKERRKAVKVSYNHL